MQHQTSAAEEKKDERKDVRYSIEQRTISWNEDDDGAVNMEPFTPSDKGGRVRGVIGASTPGSRSGRGVDGEAKILTPTPLGDTFEEEEDFLYDEGKLDEWEKTIRYEIKRHGGTYSTTGSTHNYGGEESDENEYDGAELDMYGRIYRRGDIPDNDDDLENRFSPPRSPLKKMQDDRSGLDISPIKTNKYSDSVLSSFSHKQLQPGRWLPWYLN